MLRHEGTVDRILGAKVLVLRQLRMDDEVSLQSARSTRSFSLDGAKNRTHRVIFQVPCFTPTKNNETSMAGDRGPHGHTANMKATFGSNGWAQKSNINFLEEQTSVTIQQKCRCKTQTDFFDKQTFKFHSNITFCV